MPGPHTVIDRRRVLAGAGLLALVALATPACGSAPPPPEITELESQRQQAEQDSALATAAGAALSTADSAELGPVLTQVARERAQHARALRAEIARSTGRLLPEPTDGSAGTTSATAPAEPAPTVADVTTALRAAAESAGKLAVASSGYRAGLLASIAAACTAACGVALAEQS